MRVNRDEFDSSAQMPCSFPAPEHISCYVHLYSRRVVNRRVQAKRQLCDIRVDLQNYQVCAFLDLRHQNIQFAHVLVELHECEAVVGQEWRAGTTWCLSSARDPMRIFPPSSSSTATKLKIRVTKYHISRILYHMKTCRGNSDYIHRPYTGNGAGLLQTGPRQYFALEPFSRRSHRRAYVYNELQVKLMVS